MIDLSTGHFLETIRSCAFIIFPFLLTHSTLAIGFVVQENLILPRLLLVFQKMSCTKNYFIPKQTQKLEFLCCLLVRSQMFQKLESFVFSLLFRGLKVGIVTMLSYPIGGLSLMIL